MILTIGAIVIIGATVLIGVGNSGVYGRNQGVKMGLIPSAVAVSTDTATTIAEMGQIVIDLTTGEISYVDTATKTQTLS